MLSILNTRVGKTAVSLIVACVVTISGASSAFAGVVKNELGMYTVKCQVVKHDPGLPIVGLVYGNHPKDPRKAEKDAGLYTNKFGNNVHKRHCYTRPRYKNSGAFTVNGEPI